MALLGAAASVACVWTQLPKPQGPGTGGRTQGPASALRAQREEQLEEAPKAAGGEGSGFCSNPPGAWESASHSRQPAMDTPATCCHCSGGRGAGARCWQDRASPVCPPTRELTETSRLSHRAGVLVTHTLLRGTLRHRETGMPKVTQPVAGDRCSDTSSYSQVVQP